MKFDLEIRNIQGAKRIILPLLSRYPRSFGSLEAVIDTGAPKTILSTGDAIRLNIPFNSFESTTPLTGLGKGKTPVLTIKNFTFLLRNTEGQPQEFSMPVLVVDVPRLRKEGVEKFNNATRLPTLIGIDFLEINDFSFFVDINSDVSYLEKR